MNKFTEADERMEILELMSRVGRFVQGAMTVPVIVEKEIADALKTYSSMRQVSTVVITETGSAMNWPNSDGTAEMGELLSQNQYASDADMSFGNSPIDVFRFSSKKIKLPMELMQDSGVDPLGFLINRIGARLGRITNRKFTIGTGIGEPKGIVNAASVGKIASPGQVASVTYFDLQILVGSVDEAYRQSTSCVFMMADSTAQVIRQMVDSDNRPLDLVKMGPDGKDRLLGYRLVINPDMPPLGANATPIAFGDFATYVIRDLPPEEVKRMTDSAAVLAGQVWYIGFARAGGAYTDVGGAIKLFKNASS
jgi:HK97 family phage major capsid protein